MWNYGDSSYIAKWDCIDVVVLWNNKFNEINENNLPLVSWRYACLMTHSTPVYSRDAY